MLHFKGGIKDKMAGYMQDCESQKLKKKQELISFCLNWAWSFDVCHF